MYGVYHAIRVGGGLLSVCSLSESDSLEDDEELELDELEELEKRAPDIFVLVFVSQVKDKNN